jgi:hypothetical protein
MVKSEILRILGNSEPVLSAELEQKVCDTTGCHVNTLAAVKKELGVDSYQSGRQWYSVLHGQTTKNASDHNK